ncbi:MAG: hypothetical protein COA42_02140 [Alteromonadaceae bacterium]|nr:MAG: hypothetical protein COA42_02140 [Alteromonadaceae bacterium]
MLEILWLTGYDLALLNQPFPHVSAEFLSWRTSICAPTSMKQTNSIIDQRRMTDVYLLQNQRNEFFSKSGDWLESGDSKTLYRTQYKDEAINQKVEFSVKNPELRVSLVKGIAKNNGRVIVEGFCSAAITEPTPKTLDSAPLTHEQDKDITELHDNTEALTCGNDGNS